MGKKKQHKTAKNEVAKSPSVKDETVDSAEQGLSQSPSKVPLQRD